MTELSTLPLFVLLPICVSGGLAIGYLYFRALRETADLLIQGRGPVRAIALTLGRMSLVAAGFLAAALLGGPALLATFGGVMCARWIMLRRIRGTRA